MVCKLRKMMGSHGTDSVLYIKESIIKDLLMNTPCYKKIHLFPCFPLDFLEICKHVFLCSSSKVEMRNKRSIPLELLKFPKWSPSYTGNYWKDKNLPSSSCIHFFIGKAVSVKKIFLSPVGILLCAGSENLGPGGRLAAVAGCKLHGRPCYSLPDPQMTANPHCRSECSSRVPVSIKGRQRSRTRKGVVLVFFPQKAETTSFSVYFWQSK